MDARAEELWAAILAHPDDDGPRLVYADVLLERGDPHGELINLQCLPSPDSARRRREAELIADRDRWLGELGPATEKFTMQRGFLDTLRLSGKRLHGAGVARLLANPRLGLVTKLRLDEGPLGADDVHAIVAAITTGPLGRLTALHIDRNAVGDGGAAILAPIAHLRSLHITNASVHDEGAIALAAGGATALTRLERLLVGNNGLGDASIATLCERARSLPMLNHLRFENNPITDRGMARLCESALAGQLQRVGIWGHNELTVDGELRYETRFGPWRRADSQT